MLNTEFNAEENSCQEAETVGHLDVEYIFGDDR